MPILDAHLGILLSLSVVLLTATLVGKLMSHRARNASSRAFAANWNARVCTWGWMVAVGGAALLLGKTAMLCLFVVISFLALREFAASATIPAGSHWFLAIGFYMMLPMQYALIFAQEALLAVFAVPVCTALFSALACRQSQPGDHCYRSLLEIAMGHGVCIYGMSFALAPFWMVNGAAVGNASTLVLCVVLLTQASDVFQFLWGKAIGKVRVAPRISPGKTVEGLVGGIISTATLAAMLGPTMPLATPNALVLGAVVAGTGFLGGLTLSALKRKRGIKDWGTLLPGHGGILDRVDSLWLSAPASMVLLSAWGYLGW